MQLRLLKAREYQQIPQPSREEPLLLQSLASSSGGPDVRKRWDIEPEEEDQEVTGPDQGALEEAGQLDLGFLRQISRCNKNSKSKKRLIRKFATFCP